MRSATMLLLALVSSVGAADWPHFLGPARDGTSKETGLLRTFPREGPKVLWEKEVGEGFSTPVAAGNDLVIFHRVGKEDAVECLDAATGKRRWKFDYPTEYSDRLGKGDGPRSTPVLTDKHVYTLSADGRMHCLTRADGKKVWARDLNGDYKVPQSYFGVGTSPLVDEGRVYVNVGGKAAGVVALDAGTGKEVWKATGDEASYASPVLATLGGKKRLVFFTRTGLVVLDPESGKVLHQKRWRARINASVNATSPLVVGDEVFLTSSYDTGAVLLRRTGADKLEEVWSGDESLSSHFSNVVLHDGHVYGFHGRQEQEPEFRCAEWKTGKVKWSKGGFGCGTLLAADGRLIVLSESGELVLVEPAAKGYKETARAAVLKGPIRAHLALSGGRLYGRDNAKLVCWSLAK